MHLVLGGTMLIQPMITAKMEPVDSHAKGHRSKLQLEKLLEAQTLKESKFSLQPKFQDVVFKELDTSTALPIPRKFIKRTLMSFRLIKLTYSLFISHLQADVVL